VTLIYVSSASSRPPFLFRNLLFIKRNRSFPRGLRKTFDLPGGRPPFSLLRRLPFPLSPWGGLCFLFRRAKDTRESSGSSLPFCSNTQTSHVPPQFSTGQVALLPSNHRSRVLPVTFSVRSYSRFPFFPSLFGILPFFLESWA